MSPAPILSIFFRERDQTLPDFFQSLVEQAAVRTFGGHIFMVRESHFFLTLIPSHNPTDGLRHPPFACYYCHQAGGVLTLVGCKF